MHMIEIEQRHQDIDVEEGSLQSTSSSRSRSIISLVMIVPRRANGRKPRKTSLAASFLEEVYFASVRERRASSETMRPAVLCSGRASSLAACKTSSSISSVVLMHLMITHHNSGLNASGNGPEECIGVTACRRGSGGCGVGEASPLCTQSSIGMSPVLRSRLSPVCLLMWDTG